MTASVRSATRSTRALARLPAPARTAPHLLEIVEVADFRAEDVDDDVARIDQHPVAMRHAFDVKVLHAGIAELLEHVVRDRADMTVGAAGGHHHGVGDRGFAGEVDGDDVLGLHVVEAREDDAMGLLGVRSHLGDGFGRARRAPVREIAGVIRGPFPFDMSGPGRSAGDSTQGM